MSCLTMWLPSSARRLRGMSPAAVCFLLSIFPLAAQYRAGLQGTVTDSQGGVIPGAQVTLTSKETNIAKTASTSESGVYSITGLAPGDYSLAVTKDGFATKEFNVGIVNEQSRAQDVQLDLANQATQTVTVSASETPAIETQTATISGTLSGNQIRSLPTFGRDPFQAAQLAPGSFGDNARSSNGSGSQNLPGTAGPGGTSATSSIFQTENQVQVVANGTRNSSNNFQVDGVSVNSLAWGGAAVITPNEESVKEVTVQSNPYSAENGRNSGAQVLVVSKNGTNEFHGSALFKADRPGLNAYQRYNGPSNTVQRGNDRFNQWAGGLGRRIIKNRLFFFFSYETLLNSSSTPGLNWYETPQFLSAAAAASPIASPPSSLVIPGRRWRPIKSSLRRAPTQVSLHLHCASLYLPMVATRDSTLAHHCAGLGSAGRIRLRQQRQLRRGRRARRNTRCFLHSDCQPNDGSAAAVQRKSGFPGHQ